MAKVLVSILTTDLDNDSVRLIYSVTVLGPPHFQYGQSYTIDPSVSIHDNLLALKNKIIQHDTEHIHDLHLGDIIIFGSPFVESPEALHCCSHGITSVNRSISWKPNGLGSMVKSFFVPPEPVVQVVQENDPRVEEHAQKLQELEAKLDSVKAGILLVQEEFKSLIDEHNHPYPERAVQLEGEVNSVLDKFDQHREHAGVLYEDIIQRLHLLENPPPPKIESLPEVIEEKIAEEVDVIEEVKSEPTCPEQGFWEMTKTALRSLWGAK